MNVVLVHGGAHAAWCWERLVPRLEARTRVDSVLALDLPGHGARIDERPIEDITVADYVDAVVGAVEAADVGDVVLVGHSLAGITITPAAQRLVGRLRRVIYLSTSNPPAGSSITDLMGDPRSPLSRAEDARSMFANDLSDVDAQWMLERLGPEPPRPMEEPVVVDRPPSDVPSTYVVLAKDRALPPSFQRDQAATLGVDRIVSFDAGHSAFLSRPEGLARLILDCA